MRKVSDAPSSSRLNFTRNIEWLILFLIVFFGFVFRLLVYLQYPYSYGIDGPYYNIQVKSVLSTGWLFYDDTPFIFYYFAPWALLLGDVTLGIKIGISVLSSLIAVPTFLLTKRLAGDWKAGAIAAFMVLFNPLHMRLLNDLLKNTAGIFFMLCFLYLFLKTCEKPESQYYAASFVFLLLTFTTHIYPSGLSLLVVLGYLVATWILKGAFPSREGRVSLILFGSLIVCLATLLAIMPGAFWKFSKILSFISSFEEETIDLTFHEVMQIVYLLSIPLILGLTYLVNDLWRERSGKERLLLISIFAVCSFLSLPFIPPDWRWRFSLMNFLPLAFFTGYGLIRANHDLPKIVTVALILVISFSSLYDAVLYSQRMGPIINEAGIEELEKLREVLPSDSIIIVHGRIFYWVQLITGFRTFHGREDPLKLYEEFGGNVYGLIDKVGASLPPNLAKRIVFDEGPYIVFIILPK